MNKIQIEPLFALVCVCACLEKAQVEKVYLEKINFLGTHPINPKMVMCPTLQQQTLAVNINFTLFLIYVSSG